jgi:hypothetical protein
MKTTSKSKFFRVKFYLKFILIQIDKIIENQDRIIDPVLMTINGNMIYLMLTRKDQKVLKAVIVSMQNYPDQIFKKRKKI